MLVQQRHHNNHHHPSAGCASGGSTSTSTSTSTSAGGGPCTPSAVRRTQSMLGPSLAPLVVSPMAPHAARSNGTRPNGLNLPSGASLPIRKMALDAALKQDCAGSPASSAIKKGVLCQQRDRLFSRWKERFFILTPDYLHCFKRASASHISDMGDFIFKIKLVDVESIEWIDRREPGQSMVALQLPREGRILLKSREDIREWYRVLMECMGASKERRRALRHAHELWSKSTIVDGSGFVEWLVTAPRRGPPIPPPPPPPSSRHRRLPCTLPLGQSFAEPPWLPCPTPTGSTVSVASAVPLRRQWSNVNQDTPPSNSRRYHRYSLMTDIDLSAGDLDTPPPSSPSSSGNTSRLGHAENSGGDTPHESRGTLTSNSLTPSLSFRSSASSLRIRPNSDNHNHRSVVGVTGMRMSSGHSLGHAPHLDRVPSMGSAALLLRYREKSFTEERSSMRVPDVARHSGLLTQRGQL